MNWREVICWQIVILDEHGAAREFERCNLAQTLVCVWENTDDEEGEILPRVTTQPTGLSPRRRRGVEFDPLFVKEPNLSTTSTKHGTWETRMQRLFACAESDGDTRASFFFPLFPTSQTFRYMLTYHRHLCFFRITQKPSQASPHEPPWVVPWIFWGYIDGVGVLSLTNEWRFTYALVENNFVARKPLCHWTAKLVRLWIKFAVLYCIMSTSTCRRRWDSGGGA